MAIRSDSYAFVRPVPYFLERAAEQTIAAPIRRTTDGALVEPDAGGTITIERPDGTDLVSAAAITVASSQATYTLTPASTEDLGAGWTVYWSLSFSGVAYPTYRTAAYLCEYVPPPTIGPADIYAEMPELQHIIPQAQGPRGSDVGWQPQIDAAYYALLQRLLDDGREPWLIREVTGYREWLLTHALQRCVQAIAHGPDSTWAQAEKSLHFRARAAEGRLRLQYSDEDSDVRRAGSPVIRLMPMGR